MHNSMQTNDPSAQILQKRKIRDGTDVSAWRTPCVKRALPESLSNNGGRTRKGWQTDTQESARTRRPSLVLPQRRRNERVRHQKMTLLMCLCVNGLSKPTDNVGQQAKDNWQDLKCQLSILLEQSIEYFRYTSDSEWLLNNQNNLNFNCSFDLNMN